jgi:hypothetical protein
MLECPPALRTISARLFSVKASVIQNAMSLNTGGYLEKGLNLLFMSPFANWSRKRLSVDQNNLHGMYQDELRTCRSAHGSDIGVRDISMPCTVLFRQRWLSSRA